VPNVWELGCLVPKPYHFSSMNIFWPTTWYIIKTHDPIAKICHSSLHLQDKPTYSIWCKSIHKSLPEAHVKHNVLLFFKWFLQPFLTYYSLHVAIISYCSLFTFINIVLHQVVLVYIETEGTCRNAPLPIVVLPSGMSTLSPPSTGVILTPDTSAIADFRSKSSSTLHKQRKDSYQYSCNIIVLEKCS